MSKHTGHNQEYFYKFTSMETARLILLSGKFRYSSPASFNDPFDIQTELYFNFDISDLPRLVTEEMDELVQGQRVASLDATSDLGKTVALLKEQYKKGSYKPERLGALAEPLISSLSDTIEDTRNRYNEFWKAQLKKIRVFCVSGHNKSILMWSHYAIYHTGVCFKLKVIPEIDNPLCVAKKVDYVAAPPSFFSAKEWVNSIIFDTDVAYTEHYNRYPLTKSDIWKYEDEWRVWAPFEENGKNYLDIPIAEGEIDAIYFGVNADSELVKDLIHISRDRSIDQFFRSDKKITQYGLSYTEM